MEAPFPSVAVANRFIELANESKKPVNLLKLLKLVYFAHGWHLALTDKPLLNEAVEAWKFGPVAPNVYHTFKTNASTPITELGSDVIKDGAIWRSVTPMLEGTQSLERFMGRMWEIYGKFSGFQLSELTHQEGTPWHTAWFQLGGSTRKGFDIPENLIKQYFKEKLAEQNV